jgi:hypothetical protein
MSARRTAYVVVGSLLGIVIRGAPSCDHADTVADEPIQVDGVFLCLWPPFTPFKTRVFSAPGPRVCEPLRPQVSGWQTAHRSLALVAQRAPTANTRRAAMLAPDRTGNGSSAVGSVR